MNRRLATLATGALLAGSFGLAAPAAHAAPGSCTGTGTATLSGGIGVTALYPAVRVEYDITIGCLNGGSIHAWGWLDASCGGSTTPSVANAGQLDVNGDGTSDHSITVSTTGSLVTVSGGASGNAQATPVDGNCVDGSADGFQVTGTISWP